MIVYIFVVNNILYYIGLQYGFLYCKSRCLNMSYFNKVIKTSLHDMCFYILHTNEMFMNKFTIT